MKNLFLSNLSSTVFLLNQWRNNTGGSMLHIFVQKDRSAIGKQACDHPLISHNRINWQALTARDIVPVNHQMTDA